MYLQNSGIELLIRAEMKTRGYHSHGWEGWGQQCPGAVRNLPTASAIIKIRPCWLGMVPADLACSWLCWPCHLRLYFIWMGTGAGLGLEHPPEALVQLFRRRMTLPPLFSVLPSLIACSSSLLPLFRSDSNLPRISQHHDRTCRAVRSLSARPPQLARHTLEHKPMWESNRTYVDEPEQLVHVQYRQHTYDGKTV